jgi:hypothetical protein
VDIRGLAVVIGFTVVLLIFTAGVIYVLASVEDDRDRA